MKKELRYFQKEAIDSILDSLKRGETPYINAVTGFGKSVVLAEITRRALNKNKRILQLVPNHTLCIQNYEQTFNHIDKKSEIGICCAKINKYEVNKQIVIATQTSFLSRRATSGSFDILLIDEADLVSPEPTTTYQKIIRSLQRINPKMLIVGMTGSPFRKDQGQLHDPVKEGIRIFTECCYESNIPRLIKEGYLSSVKTLNTHISVDLTGVRLTSSGEFDQNQAGVKFDAIIKDAVIDFKQLFKENGIKTALIFASTIANGQKIVDEYRNYKECKLAHGNLSKNERDQLIKWLKDGHGNRYLVNVGLYTRGFDFPGLEALVLLRATTSLRLYLQIIGRLLRTHDEKDHGFICDYGSNIERFGPIDNITPPKLPKKKGDAPFKCCGIAECGERNTLSAKKCKKCGAEFISENEDGNYTMRTKAQALAMKQEETKQTYKVASVMFGTHYKNGVAMIKADFYDAMSEYICSDYYYLEHSGSAQGLGIAKIKSFMRDPFHNWRKLCQFENGANVKNTLFLLNEYYDQFFYKIREIETMRDGRYTNVSRYIT